MRLILHTWSSTTPYACRWEHQVSYLRFWSATSCCFESTSYMGRAKCKSHKPSLPIYDIMLNTCLSPRRKPTPARITFSIAHMLYWKWYTHAGWGLGTRLAQYLQLAGRLFLCPLSPEKRAFHDSVAHSLASPWIYQVVKMFHLVPMMPHSNIVPCDNHVHSGCEVRWLLLELFP